MMPLMAQSMQKFRQIVFQLLYSRSFAGVSDELSLVQRENAIPKKQAREALEKVQAIIQKIPELDKLIEAKAIDYELDRISKIERSILHLSLFELLYTDLPDKVAIAEAIRLSRKFSTREAAAFVNAILDAIFKERDGAISEEPVTC